MNNQEWTDDVYDLSFGVDTVMTNIEKNLNILKSSFFGPVAPSNPVPCQFWLDSTTGILKFRNQAGNAWISLWDVVNNRLVSGSAIPDRVITNSMLVNTAGSEAVGTDVMQNKCCTNAKMANGAVTEPILAASCVTPEKMAFLVGANEMKITSGTVSTSGLNGSALTLPGGNYGFAPLYKTSSGSDPVVVQYPYETASTDYTAVIHMRAPGFGAAVYAIQYYIQASPPYKIGSHVWGDFIFLLRKISSKEIVSAYEAEDPPWAYNGPPENPKDSIARIQAVPHPFIDYKDRNPEEDGLEIVLVDTRNIKAEDLSNKNPNGQIVPGQELGLPETIGFTDTVKIIKP
jgi:hypothetical protein